MSNKTTKETSQVEDIKICGIVMPIAAMEHINGEYTEAHWLEVRDVIIEACGDYTARLVSESKTSGMIITDIVQNLYKDDIVICDISGRNPNVFFELGMRLTFDKPTIVLMDEDTNIPFDIQGVRVIKYPVGLNYHKINKLKKDIKDAIDDTFAEFKKKSPNTFLKQFKDLNIEPAQLDPENVTQDEVRMIRIENQLAQIMSVVSSDRTNDRSGVIPLGRDISRDKYFDWEINLSKPILTEYIYSLSLEMKKQILERNTREQHEHLLRNMIGYLNRVTTFSSFREMPDYVAELILQRIEMSLIEKREK